MNYLATQQRNGNRLPAGVLAAHLDRPFDGLQVTGDTISLEGWILGDFANQDKVRVIIRSPLTTAVVPLTVRRPDVIIAYNDSLREGHDAVCGFRHETALCEAIDVAIEVDGTEAPWLSLGMIAQKSDPLLALDLGFRTLVEWRTMNPRIAVSALEQVAAMADSDFRRVVVDALKVAASPRAFIDALAGQDAPHQAEAFVQRLLAVDLPVAMTRMALVDGVVRLPHPFGAGDAICTASWCCEDPHSHSSRVNWLFFAGEGESFAILQHVTSADAAYFPARNLLLLLQHLDAGTVQRQLRRFKDQAQSLLPSRGSSQAPRLASVIASANRPFHVFNDTLPVLEMLADSALLDAIPCLDVMDGCNFFPIEPVFGERRVRYGMTADLLNAANHEEATFSIRCGLVTERVRPEFIDQVDQRLRKAAPTILQTDLPGMTRTIQGSFPVLWCGITGQKRRWVEQVEGIVLLVKRLQTAWPSLALILDGWTYPLDPSEADRIEARADLSVADEIRARLPEDVPTIVTVGMSPPEKMMLASYADLFVANFGSGSLYVARFASRPGIAHINTAFPRIGHIHPRTTVVPNEYITDIPDPKTSRLDYVSYSLAPAVVLEMVVRLLETGTCIRDRHEMAGLRRPAM